MIGPIAHQKLGPFLQVLPICSRLLNQEILRVSGMLPNQGFGDFDRRQYRSPSPMASSNLHRGGYGGWNDGRGMHQERLSNPPGMSMDWQGAPASPSSYTVKRIMRLEIPVDAYPNFNFVGRLLGPRGNSPSLVAAIAGAHSAAMQYTKRNHSRPADTLLEKDMIHRELPNRLNNISLEVNRRTADTKTFDNTGRKSKFVYAEKQKQPASDSADRLNKRPGGPSQDLAGRTDGGRANNLSPINAVKTIHVSQTFSSLSFTSPPSVFTSPHVSLQKESRFLRRYYI